MFKREIGKLAGKRMDAAFVVLDDRLEQNEAEGLQWFLSVCNPKSVLPMHFWKDRNVIRRFLSLPGTKPALMRGVRILNTAEETHWEIFMTFVYDPIC